jgi:hypothetical protein
LGVRPTGLRNALWLRIVHKFQLHRLWQRVLLSGKDVRIFVEQSPDLCPHGVRDLGVHLHFGDVKGNLGYLLRAVGVQSSAQRLLADVAFKRLELLLQVLLQLNAQVANGWHTKKHFAFVRALGLGGHQCRDAPDLIRDQNPEDAFLRESGVVATGSCVFHRNRPDIVQEIATGKVDIEARI